MQAIRTHLLPSLAETSQLVRGTAVVIDVLRASTTIIQALRSGANEIWPFGEIEEAQDKARELAGSCLLAGERGGLKIDGFDLGNSPAEYTPEVVGQRTICFTTTNGTRALKHCKKASAILIGSFTNRKAVAGQLADAKVIHLVCAGTNGQITREDVLGAGAIARALDPDQNDCEIDDCTRLALAAWDELPIDSIEGDRSEATHSDKHAQRCERLSEELMLSQGGRNLVGIGQQHDIRRVAEIDVHDVVPRFQQESGTIRLID